jgi:hypothetical protein
MRKAFEEYLRNIARPASRILIDSQTGKDYFTLEQNSKLFALAQKITDETGVQIAHETHRNKALFAAHISKRVVSCEPASKNYS